MATSNKKDKKDVHKTTATHAAKSVKSQSKYKEKLVVAASFEQLMKELITPKKK